ncbi:MAG: cobalamin biosynthesis protein CobW [Betaproteobacteria bacterium]|nr:cobalamin biosynthesis protein CobW [Betaproteobacteria bacterium]
MTPSPALVPVTLLTGFLGSGKTTLLNHILKAAHGTRIAVIENELGQAGIDNEILLQEREEQIVETANGCICCTVRGDLTRILAELAVKRAGGALNFERVIIETTGMADPGPVAQTFFVEDEVAADYRLDGIVTLVDAKHGARTLQDHAEARRQVGFADRLLVTKTDLVSANETRDLVQRLRRMNARAQVATVEHGRAALADVLDVGGFELDAALAVDPHFLEEPAHPHEDEIGSFVFRAQRPLDLEKLESFLGLLIERYGDDMLRYKGIVEVAGRVERVIFQGVQRMVGSEPGARWSRGEKRESVIVFIGRRLPQAIFISGLELCAEGAAADPASVLRELA